jgi:hypothetical protein
LRCYPRRGACRAQKWARTGESPLNGGDLFKNPPLLTALLLTALVALWGVLDTAGLAAFAQQEVAQQFESRWWFIMLAATPF